MVFDSRFLDGLDGVKVSASTSSNRIRDKMSTGIHAILSWPGKSVGIYPRCFELAMICVYISIYREISFCNGDTHRRKPFFLVPLSLPVLLLSSTGDLPDPHHVTPDPFLTGFMKQSLSYPFRLAVSTMTNNLRIIKFYFWDESAWV